MAFFATKRLFNNLNRAIIYSQNGDPSKVLSAISYQSLPSPGPNSVNVKFLLSPINPADLNVIEGVYPAKPSPDTTFSSKDTSVFVGGNEGVARVTAVGEGVSGLKKDDWVIMTKPQLGTWCTGKNINVEDIVKVPRVQGLTEVHAATMTVNPPTAYNMIHDFVSLQPGDWVVQNGANSAVGQAVIQIAASKGLKTLNFVRSRENLEELKSQLQDLGATKVLTYDDLSDKNLRKEIKDWTGGKDLRLALNCVSGKETTLMTRLLGQNAHLVSYGAMSKLPLSLPTSLFIFKNLTTHGFWQSRWYLDHSLSERQALFEELAKLIEAGKLQEPKHQILEVRKGDTNEDVAEMVRQTMEKLQGGGLGQKVLLKFEGADQDVD